jgi:hypothetical protein
MVPWKRLEYNNKWCLLCDLCQGVISGASLGAVEGDKKGSLKADTVKYGRESLGTRT